MPKMRIAEMRISKDYEEKKKSREQLIARARELAKLRKK